MNDGPEFRKNTAVTLRTGSGKIKIILCQDLLSPIYAFEYV